MRHIEMKEKATGSGSCGFWSAWVLIAAATVASAAPVCRKATIEGEVTAGREWTAPMGQGWVFRVMPIQPAQAGYSGWDLVVDRTQAAGFPDALLLATPPYDSLNEREVGTTFRLRAQDAIGWNPRSFRFLTDPAEFHEAQQVYLSLMRSGQLGPGAKNSASAGIERLLSLESHAAAGEMRILDARLTPGVGDPVSYAQNWALAASHTPHEIESSSSGKATAWGSLQWMKFSLILLLPERWPLPAQWQVTRSACAP